LQHDESHIGQLLPDVCVADIMSRQITRIAEDARILHAAEIAATTGVTDLMVVDEEIRFVGVLSVGDILRAALPDTAGILEESGTLDAAFQLFLRKGRDLSALPIGPFVIRDPITVAGNDHVAKVVVVLIDRNIGRLPVLDVERRLIGTVSRADICSAIVAEA
jgi:predicted transcriptional regulator